MCGLDGTGWLVWVLIEAVSLENIDRLCTLLGLRSSGFNSTMSTVQTLSTWSQYVTSRLLMSGPNSAVRASTVYESGDRIEVIEPSCLSGMFESSPVARPEFG